MVCRALNRYNGYVIPLMASIHCLFNPLTSLPPSLPRSLARSSSPPLSWGTSQAYMRGQVRVSGNQMKLMKLGDVFSAMTASKTKGGDRSTPGAAAAPNAAPQSKAGDEKAATVEAVMRRGQSKLPTMGNQLVKAVSGNSTAVHSTHWGSTWCFFPQRSAELFICTLVMSIGNLTFLPAMAALAVPQLPVRKMWGSTCRCQRMFSLKL